MIDNLSGSYTPYSPQQAVTADELPDRPRIKHVAAWLGMSSQTVRLMAKAGSIPCKTIPRSSNKKREYNVYLFDKAALLEWARPQQEAI